MSMSRQHLKHALVLGLVLGFPTQGSSPIPPVRLVAQRDTTFVVPDSVRALLTFVTGMMVDHEGSLYLADPSLATILHFDSMGTFLNAIGRRGEGPGEFQSVLLVGLYRDSLWAMDPAQIRLTLMPLRGRGATTVPFFSAAPLLEAPARAQSRGGMPAAVLSDGSLLVQENVRDPSSPVGALSHGFLLRTKRNLEVVDTVAQLSLGHSSMEFVYRDGATSQTQPFGDDPLYAVSTDGSLLVTVTRVAPRGRGDSRFTVTAWRDGTRLLFTREIEYRVRRLPQSAVDSVAERLAQPLPGAGRTPITADSIRRRLFRPANFPPVEDVRIARGGEIWLKVRFADSPDGVGDWLVLSPRGFELNRVTLPASFRLLEANRKTAWGTEGDVLDVPLVVRYRIPNGGT